MKPTQVFVVRHGETAWNKEGRLQGHLDSQLTPKGIAQSKALGENLKHHDFDAIYASDLTRTRVTAENVASEKHCSITLDPQLRERHLGIFQGHTRKELAEKFPEQAKQYLNYKPDYVIPEGESLVKFCQRCMSCFNRLVAQHKQGKILIVTHGGVLTCLFKNVVGVPLGTPRNFVLLNTSLNVFSHHKGHWTLESWGDLSHLQNMTALDDS
ncbi:MAG: histidine phosphatase family protein [Thiotrichaceae bacterium]|nr:histidine phosphatase family protein [Thiotrichaceae bacterium]